MRIIRQKPGIMLASKFAKFDQRREIAVHRKYAICGDQRMRMLRTMFLKDSFGIINVVMAKHGLVAVMPGAR